MGCDIHFYVEKKIRDKWESVDKWIDEEVDDGVFQKVVSWKDQFYFGRNYDLFAILANVRNGHGFAGLDTGDGFIPIDSPKGLPSDVTSLVANKSSYMGIDGHSHSWFTVRELLEYDWTQTTKHRGYVNGIEYYKWNKWSRGMGEGPDSYCGGINDKYIKTEKQLSGLIKEIEDKYKEEPVKIGDVIKKELGLCFCPVEWEEPYYTSASGFWSRTMPRLLALGKPKDVRIVFWFDS